MNCQYSPGFEVAMYKGSKVVSFSMVVTLLIVSCQFFSNVTPMATMESNPSDNDNALVIKPDKLPDAQKGVAYDKTVTVGNVRTFVGEFIIEQGTLPPGLSLERVPSENATRITGTPQETGTFTFVIGILCEGTNAPGQIGQKEYTIVVQ
jgi:hypothetical protein